MQEKFLARPAFSLLRPRSSNRLEAAEEAEEAEEEEEEEGEEGKEEEGEEKKKIKIDMRRNLKC